jgi:hypothetical protein
VQKIELEVFSTETNATVVRMPGRRFPGVVIQGDSLLTLRERAAEIAELARSGMVDDATEAADALAQSLDQWLIAYEHTLVEHGLGLPYNARPRFLK